MDTAPITALIETARDAERAGNWDRALASYQEALGRADSAVEPDILRWMGTVHRERGELRLAMELYRRSLAAAEAAESRGAVAAGLNCMGILEEIRGELQKAERTYDRAAAIAEEIGDVRLAAMIAQNRATLATIYGGFTVALRHYTRARECFTELGDHLAAAWVLNNMGMGYVDSEDWDSAGACFQEAHELASSCGDLPTLANVVVNMAEMSVRRHDFGSARAHCDRAFELFTNLQAPPGIAQTDLIYGVLYRDTARPALAETHFARALHAARTLPDPLLEAETLQEWGVLHWELTRSREAFQCLNAAHRIFSDLHARREIGDLDRRLAQIEKVYLQVTKAWGESLEAKERYTTGHCERVAYFACSLAARLGMGVRELAWFRMGAFLHDIGKIEIPEDILNKPGTLSPEEWELVQMHPAVGDRIIAELGFPWDIGSMVRSHHERWDGGGYPDGLTGEEIPLNARILCIAEAYDALTTARNYRHALSKADALLRMREEAGRQLDPTLFEHFASMMKETPDPAPFTDPVR